MSSNLILIEIKSTIREYLPDASVVLFGSRARKEESSSSDYDLLILTDAAIDTGGKMSYEKEIRKSLTTRFEKPFDIIVETRDDWKQKRNLMGHIVYYASKEGVEI